VAYTSTDLTALDTAIAKLAAGDRVVQFSKGDQMVEYGQAKLPELRALRSQMVAEINATAGTPRHYRIATSKGL
jgi:hypothetical protein